MKTGFGMRTTHTEIEREREIEGERKRKGDRKK